MLKIQGTMFFLIYVISLSAFAETSKVHTELELAKIQIIKLTTQIEMMEKLHSDLLVTIYWSLGTLITVAIFLIGYSWFSNFRVYERDKLSLKSELTANINLDIEQIRSEFNLKTTELTAKINDQVSESIQPEVEKLDRRINSYRNDFKFRLLSIERKLIETERDKWRKEKVFSNAFRYSLNLLENAILAENSWEISLALDSIHEDLKTILMQNDPSSHLDSGDIQQAVKIIEKVDASHALIIETIKAKISSATLSNE